MESTTKRFNSIIESNKDDVLWGSFFIVPDEVVTYFKSQNITRFRCQINDLVEINCAILSGQGNKFILVNKEISKKLRVTLGSKVSVVLMADKSEYGMPVPQEIVDLFAHDEEFHQVFHELTPGKQRSLLYLVNKPKSVETRVKKAIVICNHLKERNGKLDFKILNQDFKDYNALLKGK